MTDSRGPASDGLDAALAHLRQAVASGTLSASAARALAEALRDGRPVAGAAAGRELDALLDATGEAPSGAPAAADYAAIEVRKFAGKVAGPLTHRLRRTRVDGFGDEGFCGACLMPTTEQRAPFTLVAPKKDAWSVPMLPGDLFVSPAGLAALRAQGFAPEVRTVLDEAGVTGAAWQLVPTRVVTDGLNRRELSTAAAVWNRQRPAEGCDVCGRERTAPVHLGSLAGVAVPPGTDDLVVEFAVDFGERGLWWRPRLLRADFAAAIAALAPRDLKAHPVSCSAYPPAQVEVDPRDIEIPEWARR